MTKRVSDIAMAAAMAVSAGILVSSAHDSAQAQSAAACSSVSSLKAHFCTFEKQLEPVQKAYQQQRQRRARNGRRMNFSNSIEDLPGSSIGGGRGDGGSGDGGGGGGGGGGGNRSDIRLKRDIQAIGTLANGLTLYKFKYLWSDTDMVGVMAQEVLNVLPEAVITGEDGFYRVNYDKLGISMMTFDEWKALVAELDKLPSAA